MSGIGGDELFAGYLVHHLFFLANLNHNDDIELIKNNNAIIVIEISGIAGPVKREIGSKNKRNPFLQICRVPEGEHFGFLHSAAPTP